MSFTVEQKSQLAKLMATENLTIQHQKIRTAYFDPKNRVLYLPIWQNMDGDMYDLLGGHEVGHALYTPPEGWHDVATDKTRPKAFKNFLNVVEDARIEKKVQRKYPGLKSSFRRAYKQLMDRDFFGIRELSINELSFIDRLNIFTKSQYTAYITFNADEEQMIEKVKSCETWEDVLRITEEIFEYSKGEQQQLEMRDFEYAEGSADDEYLDDYDDIDTFDQEQPEYDDDLADSEKSADGEKSENGDKDRKVSGSEKDAEDTEGEDLEQSDSNKSFNRDKESAPSERDQYVPRCSTDENYREREDSLLDTKCKEYIYVNIPKMISSEIFVPAKRVQEQLSAHYDQAIQYSDTEGSANKQVSEFKAANERYVALLAKEFEMRKAAKAFSKSKVSETGDIDVSRLAGYKFDDNIFRKVVSVPKGKSHGLILLLDCSGSMSNNMAGSIEQIIVLAMFCRKVNIPFHVFGFSDSVDAHRIDTGKHINGPCFGSELHDMHLGTIYLREYMNSNMKSSEYSKALRNMILLKKSYEGGYRYGSYFGRPESEKLSNTPLSQAIVALGQMMPDFKRKNNLDLTSLVIVHDGDSDSLIYYYDKVKTYDVSINDYVEKISPKHFNIVAENVVITDKKNKFQEIITEKRELLTILNWFKHVTGSKVFGFFLVPMNNGNIRSALNSRYYFEDGKNFYEKYSQARRENPHDDSYYELQKEYVRKFRSEKLLVSKTPGYTEFFLVAGGNELQIQDEELEIEGKVTSNKLKNAFMKMNKKKQVSRVLVTKFIQGIAA